MHESACVIDLRLKGAWVYRNKTVTGQEGHAEERNSSKTENVPAVAWPQAGWFPLACSSMEHFLSSDFKTDHISYMCIVSFG